ncbi:hypothetical protein FOA43_000818 [Brettanomyces nanus]|uniref:Pre-rRNA-processing protein RIX1 n=1 Tax=Eeniella nana TaxID=13502 RepID=A0A875RTH7_EENNA|nr:uncharacterized protein FOA43_000818 [Brettanomyces nanus]QPG73507.1 hypothetical protein FOA43_000818 [Brettanomyces nanus]
MSKGLHIVPLECILPLLEGDQIFGADFAVILQSLAKPSTIDGASKTDINHLCSRVNNYLLSKKTSYRWIGCKLFVVINLHLKVMMSNQTVNLVGSLVKILESHCYIDDFTCSSQQQLLTLNSCCEALDFIIDRIQSKPALTREILTPKLPSIINGLISNITLIPQSALLVLRKLLTKKSTTFRPFGMKFESALKTLLNNGDNLNKMSTPLITLALHCLATISFTLSREDQGSLWRSRIDDLLIETKSVLSIYEEILDTSEDEDFESRYKSLPRLPEDISQLNLVFEPLSIDISESSLEVSKISKRIELLTRYITAYLDVTTSSAVRIPLGQFICLAELLAGMNLRFSSIKRDIRDNSTRSMIRLSLKDLNQIGIAFLCTLQKRFLFDLIPHYYTIFSTLDSCIPVKTHKGKAILDVEEVVENSELEVSVLTAATVLLSMMHTFSDSSLLTRMIDSALLIVEPQVPNIDEVTKSTPSNGKNGKGKKKSGNMASFSDLIAHQDLFTINASRNTLVKVRKFFTAALSRCELPSSSTLKILRFSVLDAVTHVKSLHHGKRTPLNKSIIKLLEADVLYPAHQGVGISILPIISSLLGGENTIMSLLNNPRLPVVSTVLDMKQKLKEESEEESDESEEEEEEKEEKVKVDAMDISGDTANKRKLNSDEPSNVEKAVKRIRTEKFRRVQEEADKAKEVPMALPEGVHQVEETYVETSVTITKFTEPAEADSKLDNDDEDNSDFELPPIIAGDDDDDDDDDNE